MINLFLRLTIKKSYKLNRNDCFRHWSAADLTPNVGLNTILQMYKKHVRNFIISILKTAGKQSIFQISLIEPPNIIVGCHRNSKRKNNYPVLSFIYPLCPEWLTTSTRGKLLFNFFMYQFHI